MSIDNTPRVMNEKEMTERLLDGLKIAIDRAKEMHGLQPKVGWDSFAKQLDQMLYLVQTLLKAKGQTRQRLLQGLDKVNDSIHRAQTR